MSNINNNIPTRITQLEEATGYEDGMFFAVAKAGRGTYKIPTSEMTPNEQALSDKIENEIVPAVENSFAYGTVDESEIASFTDGSPLPMPKLEVAVEPQQDLHGYDSPWVGGGGKNKLPLTIDAIKSLNTGGTWNNNAYSINGGTLTLMTDNSGNVIGININGTFNDSTTFHLINSNSVVFPNNQYILNGISEGSASTYRYLYLSPSSGYLYSDGGNTLLNLDEGVSKIRLLINSGYNAQNVKVYPMIRLASVTDATFAPYSNICPISGWTEANVTVADDVDNPTTTKTITIQLGDTYYGGKLDVVSGELTVNKLGINVMLQEKRGWQVGSKSVCYRITLPQTATSCASNQKHGAISNIMTEQLAYYGVSRPNDLDSINFAIDTSGVALAVYDTDLTLSEQQMISKYTDLFVVYPLATPLTIQLTPTQVNSLLGGNNIFANTGKILKVEYIRDLDIVINSLLERIAALEG